MNCIPSIVREPLPAASDSLPSAGLEALISVVLVPLNFQGDELQADQISRLELHLCPTRRLLVVRHFRIRD